MNEKNIDFNSFDFDDNDIINFADFVREPNECWDCALDCSDCFDCGSGGSDW